MPNSKKGFINIQLFAEPVKDANELTIKDIEAFLNDEGTVTSTVEKEETPPTTQSGDAEKQKTIENTQAFANRLKDATVKARNEEREKIAKSMGFENYEAMQKSKEETLLKEKGFDPEEVTPIIEELLQKRLAEDPRLKELEELRQKKVEAWAIKELAELNTLTGGKISKMENVPKNVIELWKEKGSLKAAYLELEGEKLIREMQTSIAGNQSKGSTGHLDSPQGTPLSTSNANKRPMTQKEKDVYKLFNPNVTDEELAKILKDN